MFRFPSSDPWPDLGQALSGAVAFGAEYAFHLPPIPSHAIRVAWFEGTEQINGLYHFDVIFVVDADRLPAAVDAGLGASGVLVLLDTTAVRRMLHGVVSELELVSSNGARCAYRARLVPHAWRLTQSRDSRIFQNSTIVEVVTGLLADNKLSFRTNLMRRYSAKAYCVQYQESDWAFIERLLAQEGISYCFEQFATIEEAQRAGLDKAGESLLVFDNVHAYQAIDGPPELLYRPDAGVGMVRQEHDVLRLRATRRLTPNRATVRDYDFERAAPLAGVQLGAPVGGRDITVVGGVLTASSAAHSGATEATARMEIYQHHGEHTDVDVTLTAAAVVLEQHRVPAATTVGEALCRRLSPGRSFVLSECDVASLNGEYVLSSVRHRGTDMGDSQERYICHFSCSRREVLLRPAPAPAKLVQVSETAVVVGAEKEEIHTDEHGRVRVQFYWDRQGRHDDHSSCWLRVMQQWSGDGYGFQFVPRVGSEVLVSFIGGDVDRPVIIGGMPNLISALPHRPPLHQTRSAIRTRSTPNSNGYNEILFEDKAGHELVALRAERNFEHTVIMDAHINVGNDRSEQVAANSTIVIGGNASTSISGARSERVGGYFSHEVVGDVHYRHGAHQRGAVQGDISLESGGELVAAIGTQATIAVGVQQEADLTVQGSRDGYLGVARRLSLRAGEDLELRCGRSRIVLTDEGVEIVAPTIKLRADQLVSATVMNSQLRLEDNIEMVARNIFASSDGADLRLDADAWLNGAHVYLNCKPQQVAAKHDGSSEQDGTVTFQIDAPLGEQGPLLVKIMTPLGKVVTRTAAPPDYRVEMVGRPGDSFTLVEILRGDEALEKFEID